MDRLAFLKLLQRAVQKDASDIHLKTASVPIFRIDGFIIPQEGEPITSEMMEAITDVLLNAEQKKMFLRKGEVDLGFSEKGIGRFRVNIFRQRGSISIVMRRIKTQVLNFEQLHLPPATAKLARFHRGMCLITGTTGSGKSTTLASIIELINQTRQAHIVTIEDPIEYIFSDRKSIINQREVTIDTLDFQSALKSAMRQDPDIILIGEMRDHETFQACISAAETGHLVFSTLHTTNVMQTIDRIIDLFPTTHHQSIMCMRLYPRADGKGRVPAIELMFNNAMMRKLIKENRLAQIPAAIQQSRDIGMQGFNDSLHDLVKSGMIKEELGLEVSENPEELKMLLQGIKLSSRKGGILGS
jgi:twitching motility protein PilT